MAPVRIDSQLQSANPIQLNRVVLNLFRRSTRRKRPLLPDHLAHLTLPPRKQRKLLRPLNLALNKVQMNPPDRLRLVEHQPDNLFPGRRRTPSLRFAAAKSILDRELSIL